MKPNFLLLGLLLFGLLSPPRPVAAAEILCDPAASDCRARLLDLIRSEQVGIDVAFWFMEDSRYSYELIQRARAGVPVRVLVDTRANSSTPLNADRISEMASAGIPIRRRTASGILHWKLMLFSGQNTIQFSAANYSPWAFVPVTPYQNYTDEVIYFTDEASIVNSFRTKYDDLWTNTTSYADYANITAPLTRTHGIFTKDPELNFPPGESFRSRSTKAIDAEDTAIDVIMYRITDRAYTDAVIRARQRGVPVRLLTEPKQYRDPTRLWHSWNVDRMYMAGVQIKHRGHEGLVHQKSMLLVEQAMTVFGSSNWTSPSSDSQEEHNYFTKKSNFLQFFTDQFDRKWNNTTGVTETVDFVPLPPDKPTYVAPSDAASGQATPSVVLTWNAGPWAHLYDIYFGTASDPPLVAADEPLGPSNSTSDNKKFTVYSLAPGATYYWRVVSKTMAQQAKSGPIYRFTTAGDAPPPAPPTTLGPGDVLLYAAHAGTVQGWQVVSDSTAAGGARLMDPNTGAAKVSTPLANPASYFEMTFTADAGVPYHLWIRAKADGDYWANDSVHVQFSDSVNSSGAAVWRIGTTSSTEVNLEECGGCRVSGWGWQDNGWGLGVMGPAVRFATSGTHSIRVQRREDGVSIDQILLSPDRFSSTSPGALKDDETILPEYDGSGDPPPPPPPPPDPSGTEQVLYASDATLVGAGWQIVPDPTAAGGAVVQSPNANAAKVQSPLASPSSYVELTFQADANTPYRLWLRMRAQNNYWGNDSVHVQFSDSVDGSGAPAWRTGTTSGTEVNLEDCSGCGLSGWGWQDNGWGIGVMGPLISFATSGTHTLRIQVREDGVAIDQIVLSASQYLTAAPGSLKNDTTILPKSGS